VRHLETNLGSVQTRIRAAAERSGRDPAGIVLVAVTKTVEVHEIAAAYELGLRHFGENRVTEAAEKVHRLPADCTWHMIGHIQSRKAKQVTSLFRFVHSVDSAKLARRLDRLSEPESAPLPVLLEFNVSEEGSKYGLAVPPLADQAPLPESLEHSLAEIVGLSNLRVQGLMTMAPIVSHPEEARPVFARLRRLRDRLATAFPGVGWPHLSMGMSDDFEVAIEEGATMIRLGRALFAPDQPAWRKK
jgi:hypothetical protein